MVEVLPEDCSEGLGSVPVVSRIEVVVVVVQRSGAKRG